MALLVLSLAASALWVMQADRAILHQMRSDDVRILERVTVDPALDLVVALGAEKGWTTGTGEGGWWDQNRKLGLFLQRRDDPGLVYRIAIESGRGDCYARVERATATGVIISCTPEKGSGAPIRKLVYDIRAKALVKRIDYEHFELRRVFVSGMKAVVAGSDFARLVAVEYDADRDAFRVLTGAEARRWAERVETDAGRVMPPKITPVRFGPAGRFRVIPEDLHGSRIRVVEKLGGNKTIQYPLPESVHTVGSWQVAGETAWFATASIFGEMTAGLAGFGYFDTGQRKYRIWSPPEMENWSAASMLVERDAVWLGLVHYGEWRDSSGGLLRFGRATEKVEKLALRDIANGIVRVGGRLLIATDFGAALLEGGKLRRFFVDQASDGRLRVVEATSH